MADLIHISLSTPASSSHSDFDTEDPVLYTIEIDLTTTDSTDAGPMGTPSPDKLCDYIEPNRSQLIQHANNAANAAAVVKMQRRFQSAVQMMCIVQEKLDSMGEISPESSEENALRGRTRQSALLLIQAECAELVLRLRDCVDTFLLGNDYDTEAIKTFKSTWYGAGESRTNSLFETLLDKAVKLWQLLKERSKDATRIPSPLVLPIVTSETRQWLEHIDKQLKKFQDTADTSAELFKADLSLIVLRAHKALLKHREQGTDHKIILLLNLKPGEGMTSSSALHFCAAWKVIFLDWLKAQDSKKDKAILYFWVFSEVLRTLAGLGGPERSSKPGDRYLHPRYIAIVDVGSSGSRLWIYRIPLNVTKVSVVDLAPTRTEDPAEPAGPITGVLDIGATAEATAVAVNEYLEPFLIRARNTLAQLDPPPAPATVKLDILATAGLRRFQHNHIGHIDPNPYQLLTQAMTTFANNSGFLQPVSRATEGWFEAACGWVAVNFFREPVAPAAPRPLSGLLELGGASMQIACQLAGDFRTDIPEDQASRTRIKVGDHHIYARSWLGFGANEGWEAYERKLIAQFPQGNIDDPSAHDGWTGPMGNRAATGTANFSLCQGHVVACVLAERLQAYNRDVSLPIAGVPASLIGVGSFQMVLRTVEPPSIGALRLGAINFGATPWNAANVNLAITAITRKTCFWAAWAIAVLQNGLGFPEVATYNRYDRTKYGNIEYSFTHGRAVTFARGWDMTEVPVVP